jgi:hypothetical protein
VGNPAYGQWENDSSGRRRWSWAESFLFYHVMFGGRRHYYYYSDWDRWNRGYRGRRPWYGGTGADARYGTWGSDTRNSSRYKRTSFGRGGGFQSQDRGLRGAGRAARGGGPGRAGK